MLTAQDFQQKGFRLSLQVSQAEIDRATADAEECYVKRIYDGYDRPTTLIREAIMQVAFILLCQRSTVATRAGGKVKVSPSLSEGGQPSQGDFANADRLLRAIQEEEANNSAKQGEPSTLVNDIAGIYYRNKFLSL